MAAVRRRVPEEEERARKSAASAMTLILALPWKTDIEDWTLANGIFTKQAITLLIQLQLLLQ